MKIKNIENLTIEEINHELKQGAKFVIFSYCFSVIIMTYKNPTDVYFIKSGENTFKFSFVYIFLTLIFGWWGVPWGPIYTIEVLFKNLLGGKDVTSEIIQIINSE